MSQERVIVAVPKNSGEVAGVFTDTDAYDEWLERGEWSDEQLNVRNCRVKDMGL